MMLVEKVPEGHLGMVKLYLGELSNEEIVAEFGCSVEQYNRELEEGDAAIQRGEYYTQEEVFDYIEKVLNYLENKA